MSGIIIKCAACATTWPVMCGTPFTFLCERCTPLYDVQTFDTKQELLDAGCLDTKTSIGNGVDGKIVWKYYGVKEKAPKDDINGNMEA